MGGLEGPPKPPGARTRPGVAVTLLDFPLASSRASSISRENADLPKTCRNGRVGQRALSLLQSLRRVVSIPRV